MLLRINLKVFVRKKEENGLGILRYGNLYYKFLLDFFYFVLEVDLRRMYGYECGCSFSVVLLLFVSLMIILSCNKDSGLVVVIRSFEFFLREVVRIFLNIFFIFRKR